MEEIVIIGSGPAGLSAAIYAGRAMMNPVVIEGVPGGQLTTTSDVENYPGYSKPIGGPALMNEFRNQAANFNTRFEKGIVDKVVKQSDGIHLYVNEKEIITKSLLIATGANAKWLGIESEQKLRGKGVSACATCDGFFFRDKVVAVVGGGDTAMEEATYLTRFASKVYLIHRRDEFRASKIMQEKAKSNPKIEIILNAQVIEVLGTEKVTGLKLNMNSQEKELDVEGLFVAIGHQPATEFLKDSGVLFDESGYIYTTERIRFENNSELFSKFPTDMRYATSVEGIFAAGDCVDAKYRQAGTAVGMGIAAQIEIERWLNK